MAFPTNDSKVVLKFLKKHIFIRFGTPRAVISDGGTHFCFVDTNIGVFRDSLCVWQDSNTHLGLWQMRKFGDDKSWIQLINFSYLHLNIRPYEEKSMILPLCMSNNGDFFMLKFTRNADDEYQTIL